jgi:hypothetical protein
MNARLRSDRGATRAIELAHGCRPQHGCHPTSDNRYGLHQRLGFHGRLGVSRRLVWLRLMRGRGNRVRHRLRDLGFCRRLGRDGRSRSRRSREKRQGIDVTLLVACDAHPEVHERLGEIDLAARAHCADGGALGDVRTALHVDRPQVDERQRVPGRRLDGDGLATRRDRARKGHDTRTRRDHGSAARRPEVDAAVLPRPVGMRAVERERSQHRPCDGPRPGMRGRDRLSADTQDQQNHESPHELLLVVRFGNGETVTGAALCCQYWLQSTAVELVARDARQAGDELGRAAAGDAGGHQLGDGFERLLVLGRTDGRPQH